MTPRHFNDEHHHWTHVVDYETLWVLAFAAVVIGSGFFALLISQLFRLLSLEFFCDSFHDVA